MFRNYLKVALRNSWKHKLPTFINLFSLAFGIAACLVIYLFIQDESSFDGFHSAGDRIYRLNEVQSFPGTNTQHVALSMPGMAPNLQKDYPEVENYTRFWGRDRRLFVNGDQRYIVEKTAAADSTFLDIFNFPLLEGNAGTALDEPYSLVLTESVSQRFFGNESPLGRSLVLNDKPYQITGLMADVPENSHLQFEVLLSMTTFISESPDFNQQFGSNYLVTYLLMKPGVDMAAFEAKMPDFLSRYMPPNERDGLDINEFYRIYYQHLPEVHLASMDVEHDYQNYRKFNGSYLRVFALVGIFILLIACFNFMNLIIARAAHRWKEVGVRKSVGALKNQLFSQFLVESVMLGLIAFFLAILLNLAFVPLLNLLVDRELSMTYFLVHPLLLILAFLLSLALGLLAGLYPAFYLASYDTIKVLKGGDLKNRNSVFSSGLVVLQFGLAIGMIISTLVVVQQLWYMKNKDIGFNKDHILLVSMNSDANKVFETLKTELLKSSQVVGVTASGQRLGNNFHQWGFKLKTDSIVGLTPSNVNVDYDYLDVYQIKVKDGRGFSRDFAKDNGYAFVINESFARDLGMASPVGIAAGHSWYPDDSLGTIIGVVEDFNFNSLHYDINTLALVVHPEWGYEELSVRISGENIPATIREVERTWNDLVPSWPFQYSFLDEHFAELYRSDQQMESVVSIMAILAILIACMGLFGLAAITTESKIKEIGIRKILGASLGHIMNRLSRNFAMMILIAFVLFTPLTWLLMHRWLENFAYRIEIQWWVFILGGILALGIALLTISYHIIRSARVNPVESLRYE